MGAKKMIGCFGEKEKRKKVEVGEEKKCSERRKMVGVVIFP